MENDEQKEPEKVSQKKSSKEKLYKRNHERRRQDLLSMQQKARRELANLARDLATATTNQLEENNHDDMDTERSGGKAKSKKNKDGMEVDKTPKRKQAKKKSRSAQQSWRQREYFSKQLCTPEWMTHSSLPDDLNGGLVSTDAPGQGWFVRARPEGKRCLLITSMGQTVSRTVGGDVLHRFQSCLPHGSYATRSGPEAPTVLECIFSDLDGTYFILDMMCWKGYSLYDCTCEFRFYWMRTKLEDEGVFDPSRKTEHKFAQLPYFECDMAGLQQAYSGQPVGSCGNQPVLFIRDGLIFYHKQSHYYFGPTPLTLVWKDAVSSRYLIFSETQRIILRVGKPLKDPDKDTDMEDKDGVKVKENQTYPLLTMDNTPLGTINSTMLREYKAKIGNFLRFEISRAEETEEGPMVHDLTFSGKCSKSRSVADSWSKILFQHLARVNPLGIDSILQVVSNGPSNFTTMDDIT